MLLLNQLINASVQQLNVSAELETEPQ